ncbi:hypothetical protein TW95_gp0526 [Pandoravirus inopinatum]|uniref:Uncharacterized protein n=1 Tax=Pandoravirus inopinatum TaxID=1605721 RepID=A0A0B5J698_9VIRU|nr:hypothetical protein TW95_gp0526 [Pandoravirus inopinatum]AJF97260.1 hypothetical protein [Pandoravirus inopinatum]
MVFLYGVFFFLGGLSCHDGTAAFLSGGCWTQMSAAVACLWSALVLQSVYGSGEFGPVGSPDQRLVAQKGKMSIFYRVSLFSSIANKHTGFFFFRIFSNSEIGRPAFFSRKSTGMGGPSAALYFILLLFFVSKSFLFYYILLSGARPRRNKDASTQKKKEAAQKRTKDKYRPALQEANNNRKNRPKKNGHPTPWRPA